MNTKEIVSGFSIYIEMVIKIRCINVSHEDTDWSQALRASKTDYLSGRLDMKLFAHWPTFCDKFKRVVCTEQVVLWD